MVLLLHLSTRVEKALPGYPLKRRRGVRNASARQRLMRQGLLPHNNARTRLSGAGVRQPKRQARARRHSQTCAHGYPASLSTIRRLEAGFLQNANRSY
jgi:hypothetical protein